MGGVIYLIRHTSVEEGLEGICYGQSDVQLSAGFEAEAAIVAQKLSGVTLDMSYSSPLSRCVQLSTFLGYHFRSDDRLREMNFGQWELVSWNDIYQSTEGKVWFEDYLNQLPPEGESFSLLINRISDFIREYIRSDQPVAIVTHAGPIRAFLVAMGLVGRSKAFDVKLAYGEVIKIENNSYNYITL